MGFIRGKKQYSAKLSEADNILGQGTSFEGSIETIGSLKIDGEYKGESLKADKVIVGLSGKVKANIFANTIILEGIVIGDIIANTRVLLMAKSKLVGNISTPELISNEGVLFEGLCRVSNDLRADIGKAVHHLYNKSKDKDKFL